MSDMCRRDRGCVWSGLFGKIKVLLKKGQIFFMLKLVYVVTHLSLELLTDRRRSEKTALASSSGFAFSFLSIVYCLLVLPSSFIKTLHQESPPTSSSSFPPSCSSCSSPSSSSSSPKVTFLLPFSAAVLTSSATSSRLWRTRSEPSRSSSSSSRACWSRSSVRSK